MDISQDMVKAPFIYFGGKSRIAKTVWSGLGEVHSYVEPFAGSLAVLLANPSIPKMETINDKDCFIVNFWRAVSDNPEEVAKYADTPVHEADLHARHIWLLKEANDEFRSKMNTDPNFYDAKMAGWWVWGICASIGSNWLQPKGLNAIPMLGSAGSGIHGLTNNIQEWFIKLQTRLRRVRMTCGDWTKLVSPTVTYKNVGLGVNEIVGVFLDPPYASKNRDGVYLEESNIYNDVCKWAVDNGNNSKLRIVVCGYDGDFTFPDDWQVVPWKANGGYANLGKDRGKDNAGRERIYFSPHCIKI